MILRNITPSLWSCSVSKTPGFCFLTTHIYIFVKDRFNATQFLNHPLLEINCLGVTSSTTNSTHVCRLVKVERWSEFLNNAKEYILDDTATFSASLSITRTARNEAEVDREFSFNVISNITTYVRTVARDLGRHTSYPVWP